MRVLGAKTALRLSQAESNQEQQSRRMQDIDAMK
jgi:hypothetical protein